MKQYIWDNIWRIIALICVEIALINHEDAIQRNRKPLIIYKGMTYKRKFWIKEVKEEKTEGGKQGKEIILTLLFITADCCLSGVFCVRFNIKISSWMASEVGLFKR